MGWEAAGQAWGRQAWDWALLQEQLTANSFDLLQQLTGVGDGVRVLDLACGSGLALQRAQARRALCFGIDASEELLAVAAERAPDASLTHGDTAELPYDDDTFDVVTWRNGIQEGSDQVLVEAARAIEHSGPAAFRVAIHEAIEPYIDPASGRVRMVATMGHLVARKPSAAGTCG